MLVDSQNRIIDYMRLSITDRCNLRCGYCMPDGLLPISHDDILRYEEILRLCTILSELGIKNIRITGGEPLVRKDCVGLIKRLKHISGVEHVTLTTNAILLEPYLNQLTEAGLNGINISLDSLNPETYKQITGKDELGTVLRAIEKALRVGLNVKINCVLMKGINENDILSMIEYVRSRPIDVRFIEFMPTKFGKTYIGVKGEDVLKILISELNDIEPDPSRHGFGPAKYYKSKSLVGKIGLISAVSEHICSECNRLRLTSEGFLKLCLNYNDGPDLRYLLRNGFSDSYISEKIVNAVLNKPKEFNFKSNRVGIECMSNIGG